MLSENLGGKKRKNKIMKRIINITDITEYLYCPRKVYLKIVKGIKAPPNKKMILGMLRHKVFDVFNKNESSLVSGIKSKLQEKEIEKLYDDLLNEIIKETLILNKNLVNNFQINEKDFSHSVKETSNPEIKLRVDSVAKALSLGFFGKELWRNLKPKYLTEFKIESPELGLRGRVDRIKFSEEILPVERKTREKIFESDKIQLAGYALLLENEFGKPISQGIIEIMGKQETVLLDEELKNKVLDIAEKIRNLKDETAFTPSNFSKCENCEFRQDCEENL